MIDALTIAIGIWLGVLFVTATLGAYFAVLKRIEDYRHKRRLGFSHRHALRW